MTVTLTDLLALPPSLQRDRLIARETPISRAVYDRITRRHLEARGVTEVTRIEANRILATLPRENAFDVARRRLEILEAQRDRRPAVA